MAPELGIHVAGVRSVGTEPRSDAVAAAVERSGADGVVLGTALAYGGGDLIEALRKRLGDRVTLLAGDGFTEPDTLRALGRPADGLYVVVPQACRPPPRTSRRRHNASSASSASGRTRSACWRPPKRPRPCWRRSPAPTAPAPPCSPSSRTRANRTASSATSPSTATAT